MRVIGEEYVNSSLVSVTLEDNGQIYKAMILREGHWEDRGSLSCRCSECGCKSTVEYKYCPNCLAKMKVQLDRLEEIGLKEYPPYLDYPLR